MSNGMILPCGVTKWMQERFTVRRAALELTNATSAEVSEGQSVRGKRKA